VNPITIYNIHTHIFTIYHVPEKYLPFGLVRLFKSPNWRAFLRWFLHVLARITKKESLERIAVFSDAAAYKTQRGLLVGMMGFYPPDTRFGLLTMDMAYMGAGKAEQDYLQQLEQVAAIKQEYQEHVIPFMAIDPRRPNLLELVKKYADLGFGGFKLYPPLGFYPFDERLDDVYAFAESEGLPIIAHCSPGGVYWRGRITPEMRVHPKTGKKLEEKGNARFARNFTDPANYEYVFEKFPKLKICLAHFGGGQEWSEYLKNYWPPEAVEKRLKGEVPEKPLSWLSLILDMMKKYDTLYADISYTAHEERFLPVIKVFLNTPQLREKILYGSDCYMVLLDKSERAFSMNVRGYLGEQDYRQMAETNPRVFLARNAAA
jgi:uncharacterized protein